VKKASESSPSSSSFPSSSPSSPSLFSSSPSVSFFFLFFSFDSWRKSVLFFSLSSLSLSSLSLSSDYLSTPSSFSVLRAISFSLSLSLSTWPQLAPRRKERERR